MADLLTPAQQCTYPFPEIEEESEVNHASLQHEVSQDYDGRPADPAQQCTYPFPEIEEESEVNHASLQHEVGQDYGGRPADPGPTVHVHLP